MNTSTSTLTTVEDKLSKCKSLITSGISAIKDAGNLIVSLIDDDRLTVDQIVEAFGVGGNRTLVLSLERIGRAELRPELLFSPMAAASPMRKLPFSEQGRLIENGYVELLVIGEGGKTDILNAPLTSLSTLQIKQVFGNGYVRSVQDQRVWLEGQTTVDKIKQSHPPAYEVKKGELVFPALDLKFNTSQVATLLAQMEASKR